MTLKYNIYMTIESSPGLIDIYMTNSRRMLQVLPGFEVRQCNHELPDIYYEACRIAKAFCSTSVNGQEERLDDWETILNGVEEKLRAAEDISAMTNVAYASAKDNQMFREALIVTLMSQHDVLPEADDILGITKGQSFYILARDIDERLRRDCANIDDLRTRAILCARDFPDYAAYYIQVMSKYFVGKNAKI